MHALHACKKGAGRSSLSCRCSNSWLDTHSLTHFLPPPPQPVPPRFPCGGPFLSTLPLAPCIFLSRSLERSEGGPTTIEQQQQLGGQVRPGELRDRGLSVGGGGILALPCKAQAEKKGWWGWWRDWLQTPPHPTRTPTSLPTFSTHILCSSGLSPPRRSCKVWGGRGRECIAATQMEQVGGPAWGGGRRRGREWEAYAREGSLGVGAIWRIGGISVHFGD